MRVKKILQDRETAHQNKPLKYRNNDRASSVTTAAGNLQMLEELFS